MRYQIKDDAVSIALGGTREELAEELAAAGEYTEDWETAELEDLRERVMRLELKP